MARKRFTVTDLREGIQDINEWLAEAGSNIRMRESGRNGYQAVDEFELNDDGTRPDTCVRNVGCGTSREVYDYAYERYRNILAAMDHDKMKALEAENAELRKQLTPDNEATG